MMVEWKPMRGRQRGRFIARWDDQVQGNIRKRFETSKLKKTGTAKSILAYYKQQKKVTHKIM